MANPIIPREPSRYNKDSNFETLMETHQVLRAGISYGNVNGTAHVNNNIVNVPDTGVKNTEFVVNHKLGIVPTGYQIWGMDLAGIIYRSGTAWTEKQIFLKCTVDNVLNLLLEIF